MKLIAKLEGCSPAQLAFPGTRSALEKEIYSALTISNKDNTFDKQANIIESLLHDSAILYPYIELPSDVETYIEKMSKGTRKYFLRPKRRFEDIGGIFQKVCGYMSL